MKPRGFVRPTVIGIVIACVLITSGPTISTHSNEGLRSDFLAAEMLPNAIPSNGTWYVNNTQVVQNQSILLNGNLSVGSTGNLTLKNVSLTLNPQYIDEYGIEVESGGAMYVYDSSIAPSNLSQTITFVDGGKPFVVDGSNLSGIGYCPAGYGSCTTPNGSYIGSQGLTIEEPGAVVENSTCYECGVGVTLMAGFARIEDDQFLGDVGGGIIVTYGHAPGTPSNPGNESLIHNRILFPNGVLAGDQAIGLSGTSGNLVANNTITASAQELSNTGSVAWGLLAGNSWNNTIVGNSMAVPSGEGLWLDGGCSNNRILNNTMLGSGFTVFDSPDNEFVGNSLGTRGIGVQSSQNTTIADNTLGGILFEHSSNSSLLDNNITGLEYDALVIDFADTGDVFEGNTIADHPNSGGPIFSYLGLYLLDSSFSVIEDNNITGYRAIAVENSKGNTIYGNDFSNLKFPSFDSGGNGWDHNGIGNFWSDYTGPGPYSIPPNGTDYSPLTTPTRITPVPIPSERLLPFPVPYTGPCTCGVITNTTIYDHESLNFPSLQLTIATGGTLIINDSHFNIGSSGGGDGITINPGGTLIISNSTGIWSSGSIRGGDGLVEIVNSTLEVGRWTTFGISFEDGMVVIDGSNILASQAGYGFQFRDLSLGGMLSIQHSDLENGTQALDGNAAVTAADLVANASRFVGAPGAIVGMGSKVIVTNCSFLSDLDAAMVGPSNLSVFSDNVVKGLLDAVSIVANVAIANDNFIEDGWTGGLQVTNPGYLQNLSAESATTMGNVIESTFQGGLGVKGNNAIIEGNTLGGSPGGGIEATGSDSLMSGNIISGASDGIGIDLMGNGNLLVGNTVLNSSVPISVSGNENLVYHNNFQGYSLSAGGSGANDSFDWENQGNYWSDYNGTDPDLDGIGDTPYALANGMVDSYPFMQPNGWLSRISVSIQTGIPDLNFSIDSHSFVSGTNDSLDLLLGAGESYNVTFPSQVSSGPGTRWNFAGWNDGYSSPQRMVQLTNDSVLSVSYQWQNQLTLLGSNVDVFPGGWYVNGTTVNISAQPKAGFVFLRWEIVDSTSSPIANPNASSTTVLIRGPITLVALVAPVSSDSGSPLWVYAIIGAVVALCAIGVAAILSRRRGKAPPKKSVATPQTQVGSGRPPTRT